MATSAINIRAHRSTVDLIDRAADIEGKTRSEFLRDCAMAAANKVFEKPRLYGEPCPICGRPTPPQSDATTAAISTTDGHNV